MNIKKIDILGVPAHTINFEETIRFITDAIENHKQQTYIVAQNAEKIMMARKDRELADLMNEALLLYPDGVGVSLASRILYSKPVSRVPGFDLFLELLKLASKRNMKIFLLGSRDDIINTTKTNIQKDYPGIDIVGYQNGYFKSNDEVIKLINGVSPDILFVGMGSPKQERWSI
jgi:N-acetylglucosaminyldiphosphoundecaprenol N-acetyl-beta-D-mannosaminyltransferase